MPISKLPPLSLYVHLPWCVRKCPYCDFNSHALNPNSSSKRRPVLDTALEAKYVQALLADLDHELAATPNLAERPITSVFFGGGTPSLMSPFGYQTFFRGLKERLYLALDAEITLEANPGAVEQEKFAGYLAAGINRLSIGVQSFQDAQLKALGRIHSGAEAIKAIQAAKTAGFQNFNLDLMHGLPGQSTELALADLQQALDLQPQHLSWYQLTVEPNTVFYRQPPKLPAVEILENIQDLGQELLLSQGWQHYEVSAFAQPNFQSQHNLNYWQFGDYLGLGAGAHGKLSSYNPAGELQVVRSWKTRQPQDYLQRLTQNVNFNAGSQVLSAADLELEFMLNALRLTEGVPTETFTQRTGLNVECLAKSIQQLQEKGLWTNDPQRLACSELGWRWLNTVLEQFMSN